MKVRVTPLNCETIQGIYDNYAVHPTDPMVYLALLGDERIVKHLTKCQSCFDYGEKKATEAMIEKIKRKVM